MQKILWKIIKVSFKLLFALHITSWLIDIDA